MKTSLIIPVLSAVLLVIVLTIAYKIQPVASPTQTDKNSANIQNHSVKEPDSSTNRTIYSRRPAERRRTAASPAGKEEEKITKNDIPQLIANISKSDGKNMLAPSELDKLIQTTSLGEAMNFTKGLSDDVIRSLIKVVPDDYLKQKLLTSGLGITEDDIKKSSPEEIVTAMLQVAKGEFNKGAIGISFGTEVEPGTNRPVNPRTYFATTDKKIYACFPNEGALHKLNKVVITWMNSSLTQIAYWGAQPIDPNAPYNYIYVNYVDNWEPGMYSVAIFKDVSSKEALASGAFQIK